MYSIFLAIVYYRNAHVNVALIKSLLTHKPKNLTDERLSSLGALPVIAGTYINRQSQFDSDSLFTSDETYAELMAKMQREMCVHFD